MSWTPGTETKVTDHVKQRWAERVWGGRRRETDGDAVIDAKINQILADPPSHWEGRDVHFVEVPGPTNANRGRAGWVLKLADDGNGWAVVTVTRRHYGKQSNQAERARVRKRNWQVWQAWCLKEGLSPLDPYNLHAFAHQIDKTATQSQSRIGAHVRAIILEIGGADPDKIKSADIWALLPPIAITSATGKIRWF